MRVYVCLDVNVRVRGRRVQAPWLRIVIRIESVHIVDIRSRNQMSMHTLGYGEESVSVAFQEVEPDDWAEKVYRVDIVENDNNLYKKPG